jgi:hypothetical protein
MMIEGNSRLWAKSAALMEVLEPTGEANLTPAFLVNHV